jgi:large subunit ribosomal protein L1
MQEAILKAIQKIKKSSKKRNFIQTFDLIVNLRDIDVKKPENRFSEDLELPHGKGKESSIVIFGDAIRGVEAKIIKGKEIEKIAKSAREIRKLANSTDFFLAEPQLMPIIGRYLGKFLGPRGKVPRVIRGDVKALIEMYKKCVRVKLKDSPVVQCAVGNEEMEDEKIAENIETVLNFLKEKLPKGEQNIKEVLLKLTMGKPVRIEYGKGRKS